MLKAIILRLKRSLIGPEPPTMRAHVEGIDDALSVIAAAGYQVHIYCPSLGAGDHDLAKAFQVLARSGQFIVTDRQNNLVGLLHAAQTGSEIRAQRLRAQFKVVD